LAIRKYLSHYDYLRGVPYSSYSCPEHYNPADFFLDIISRDGRSKEAEQESQKKIEYLAQCFEKYQTQQTEEFPDAELDDEYSM